MITSVKKQGYDIIVVGGGIAGCCAALAAARENKSVLLVEKHINLGGLATIGLISWFEPLCDGEGRKMMAAWRKKCNVLRSVAATTTYPKSGAVQAETRNQATDIPLTFRRRFSRWRSMIYYVRTALRYCTTHLQPIRKSTIT